MLIYTDYQRAIAARLLVLETNNGRLTMPHSKNKVGYQARQALKLAINSNLFVLQETRRDFAISKGVLTRSLIRDSRIMKNSID